MSPSTEAHEHADKIRALFAAHPDGAIIRALVLGDSNGNGAAPEPVDASWQPQDLAAVLAALQAGEQAGPVPELLTRTDGQALVYPGEVHSIAGEPEAGKGWIVLAECARILAGSRPVLYLDFEDAPASVAARLLALGADAERVREHFHYVRPEAAPTDAAIRRLAAPAYALAVIDGLSEAYSLMGLDYASNADVPIFLRRLARPLTTSATAVVQIDHVPKDRQNRNRYAIGAQHKLAGVAAAYGIEVIDRPNRTTPGRVKLTLAKDRHGHVPGGHGAPVALVTITPAENGQRVTVTLDPPDSLDAAGTFRPTGYMERVSRWLEANPDSSTNAVTTGTGGNAAHVRTALAQLVTEGYITRTRKGQAHLHTSARPFREDDDRDPASEPRPNHVQTQLGSTASPSPSPVGGTGHGTRPTEPTTSPLPSPYDPHGDHA